MADGYDMAHVPSHSDGRGGGGASASVKVHVELPGGSVSTFRIKRKKLGAFDELCDAVAAHAAEAGAPLEPSRVASMTMMYQDADRDMLAMSRASDVRLVARDAVAIFVSSSGRAARGGAKRGKPRELEHKLVDVDTP